MAKLKITRTVVWKYEQEYTPESYPGDTLEEAAEYERNLEDPEAAEQIISAMQYADDGSAFTFTAEVEIVEE